VMNVSHPSHSYQTTQRSRLSPLCPQVWMSAVYKAVYKQMGSARIVEYVRLSPSVDALWTKISPPLRDRHQLVHCSTPAVHTEHHTLRRPQSIRRTTSVSTQPLHNQHAGWQEANRPLSTLSPTPMTTTTFHHRHRVGPTTKSQRWTTPVPSEAPGDRTGKHTGRGVDRFAESSAVGWSEGGHE